jgi:hypothetical protein
VLGFFDRDFDRVESPLLVERKAPRARGSEWCAEKKSVDAESHNENVF